MADSKAKLQQLKTLLSSILLDKEKEIELCLLTIFSRGHLLIEDIPGVGKTTLVHSIAHLVGLPFARVQGTSDLLPADIIGSQIFNSQKSSFEFHPGPLFKNILLVDELNRMNPRTQSALLQGMEEGEVSVEGSTLPLPKPFFVIATQNPQTQTGTFPLPESQLDRFMTALELMPASQASEQKLIAGFDPREELKKHSPLLTLAELSELFKKGDQITISTTASAYITSLLAESRHDGIQLGLSTRAGIALGRMARAKAFFENRPGVLIEDIQFVAPYVFAHRLGGERGLRHGLRMAEQLVQKVPVPV